MASSIRDPIEPEVVGLAPAAGFARRLGELGVCKEALPWPERAGAPGPGRIVVDCVLRSFAVAGVRRAYVVARREKRDLIESLERRASSAERPALSLVATPSTPSVPHTIDRAYGSIRGKLVLFGFPDLVFEPADAASRVLEHLRSSRAGVVLGAFPSDRPEKTDLLTLDGTRVVGFRPRQRGVEGALTWLLAAWRPAFTEFLHGELGRRAPSSDAVGELHIHALFSAAQRAGIEFEAVRIDGRFLDVGTPGDLERLQA